MLSLRRFSVAAVAGLLASIAGGCGSSQPTRVEMPGINPSDAGSKAVSMYDTNKDGAISGDELQQVPAIKAALARYDNGGDGKVTADTIARRLQQWLDTKLSLMTVPCRVTLDGKPLEGATVTLEPEPFLGPSIEPATGTTDATGSVLLSVNGKPGLVRIGLYKVKVSKQVGGKETIPARYNGDHTELGVEVAQDSPQMERGAQFVLALKSK